jgi:hypothetical protein
VLNMNRWNKQQAVGWAKTNKEDKICKGVGKRLSITRGRDQNGRIPEVPEEIAAQVCIKCTQM